MVDFLTESGRRANRPSIVNAMLRSTNAKYEQDIKTMIELADESKQLMYLQLLRHSSFQSSVIEDRKCNPIEKKDLLNTMLYSADPKTGEHLKDETIRNNVSQRLSNHTIAFHLD